MPGPFCIEGQRFPLVPTFDVDRTWFQALALSNPVKLFHFGK